MACLGTHIHWFPWGALFQKVFTHYSNISDDFLCHPDTHCHSLVQNCLVWLLNNRSLICAVSQCLHHAWGKWASKATLAYPLGTPACSFLAKMLIRVMIWKGLTMDKRQGVQVQKNNLDSPNAFGEDISSPWASLWTYIDWEILIMLTSSSNILWLCWN